MRTVLRSGGRRAALIAIALAAGGCSTNEVTVHDRPSRPSDPYTLGPGCDTQPDPHCDNTINRVVIQMLRGVNRPVADENSSRLCRRMAIDLVGRIPTVEESHWCEGASATQMANYFMSTDEYVVQQARSYGEKFYDLDEQWYLYVVELDNLVRSLFRDQVRYDEFMTRFIVHPGFYARFQGDDWASNVVRYALGRPARADEVQGMRALERVWDSRYFCDGIVWWNSLQDNGGHVDDANNSCGRTEWGLNFCNCVDGDGNALCVSNTFGSPVDFGIAGCVDPDHGDSARNLLRASDAAAGRVAICPNGDNTEGCADRQFGDMGFVGQLPRLDAANGAQFDRMHSLGRVLSSRQDFWEAAVDREMRRFLSWWQNGLRRPDYDIPDVRRVLAQQLKQTNSIRQLQYTIVTSLLYTQPAELGADEPEPAPGDPVPPVWAFGPTRVLTGERWLDSAEMATFGHTLGVCDYRFVASNNDWSRLVDRRLITQPVNPMDYYIQDYHDWASSLGGCQAGQVRPLTSTLAIASAQNYLTDKLCANGYLAEADKTWSPYDYRPENMNVGITQFYRSAFSRDPTPEELDSIRNEAIECFHAGAEACEYYDAWLRWTCARLMDSAEFAIY